MRKSTPAILVASLALALGACNRNDTDIAATEAAEAAAADAAAASTVDGAADTSATATPSVGSLVVGGTATDRYLTDNAGRAVYILEGDDTGTRCIDDCLQAWPVVAGGAPVSGVPEVRGDLISTTTRADGTVQVTYAGHPLYYFAEDAGPGMTNGRDIADKWGRWTLVSPDGAPLAANMAATGSTSTEGTTTSETSTTPDAADTGPEPTTEPANDGY